MTLLAPLYDAAFDGSAFFELAPSGRYPGQDVGTAGTAYRQGSVYIDMGEERSTFDIQAGVEAAQLAALKAKRGDTGTLSWSRGTQTATLLNIVPKQAGVMDGYIAVLTFFASSAPSAAIPSDILLTDAGGYLLDDAGGYLLQG